MKSRYDAGEEIQIGREWPISTLHRDNMTARNVGWFYVVRRRGDPLVHACTSWSPVTSCGLRNMDCDVIEPGCLLELTCISCSSQVPVGHPMTSLAFEHISDI